MKWPQKTQKTQKEDKELNYTEIGMEPGVSRAGSVSDGNAFRRLRFRLVRKNSRFHSDLGLGIVFFLRLLCFVAAIQFFFFSSFGQ